MSASVLGGIVAVGIAVLVVLIYSRSSNKSEGDSEESK